MKNILVLFSGLFFLLPSCSENVTSPGELYQGEIIVEVKNVYLDQLPRTNVKVTLSMWDEKISRFNEITTLVADLNGMVRFTNLQNGEYHISPREDDQIGLVVSSSGLVNDKNPIDTVEVLVNYYWNFNEYGEDFEVDTSLYSQGLISFFNNTGMRDTLICEFDLGNKPNWMRFEYSHSVYAPDPSNSNNSYIFLGYRKDEIPIDQLPISVIIPIRHQYGITNYEVIYKLKE